MSCVCRDADDFIIAETLWYSFLDYVVCTVADLAGIILAGIILAGIILAGIILAGIILAGIILAGIILAGIILAGIIFSNFQLLALFGRKYAMNLILVATIFSRRK